MWHASLRGFFLWIAALFLFSLVSPAKAQLACDLRARNKCTSYPDSLRFVAEANNIPKTFRASFTYSLVATATPLTVGSFLAFKSADRSFHLARRSAIPAFRYRYDDYSQYFPLALGVGLGLLSGNYGTLSPREFFTAYATGYLLTAVSVLPIKSFMGRLRPDGSTFNSFPSGHTATAFAGAELLDLTYGEAYPWLSSLGYSAACITATGRVLNNRHWVSDVFAGAALGILSADVGYYLASRFWKDHPRALGYTSVEIPSEGTWLWGFANAVGAGGTTARSREEATTLFSERVRSSAQLLYRFPVKEKASLAYTVGFGVDFAASPSLSKGGEPRVAPYLITEAASPVTRNAELGVTFELGGAYGVLPNSRHLNRGAKTDFNKESTPFSVAHTAFLGWRVSLFGDLYIRSYRSYRLFLAVGNIAAYPSFIRKESVYSRLPLPQFELGCAMRLFP